MEWETVQRGSVWFNTKRDEKVLISSPAGEKGLVTKCGDHIVEALFKFSGIVPIIHPNDGN